MRGVTTAEGAPAAPATVLILGIEGRDCNPSSFYWANARTTETYGYIYDKPPVPSARMGSTSPGSRRARSVRFQVGSRQGRRLGCGWRFHVHDRRPAGERSGRRGQEQALLFGTTQADWNDQKGYLEAHGIIALPDGITFAINPDGIDFQYVLKIGKGIWSTANVDVTAPLPPPHPPSIPSPHAGDLLFQEL